MLSCMSCLYILYVNPLSVSFVNIFYHSVGYLFILSMVFFAVPKLLSLIRSHLFIFAILSFTLEDRSKNITMIFFFFLTFIGAGAQSQTRTPNQQKIGAKFPWFGCGLWSPQPPVHRNLLSLSALPITMIFIKECPVYAFLWEFYGFRSYI